MTLLEEALSYNEFRRLPFNDENSLKQYVEKHPLKVIYLDIFSKTPYYGLRTTNERNKSR